GGARVPRVEHGLRIDADCERRDRGAVVLARAVDGLAVQKGRVRRPLNNECPVSTPLSTITIGTPGPGGADWSARTSWDHHPWPWRTAAAASRARRPTGTNRTLGLVARAYVGLGSNLGDRERTIRRALDELAAEPGIRLVA